MTKRYVPGRVEQRPEPEDTFIEIRLGSAPEPHRVATVVAMAVGALGVWGEIGLFSPAWLVLVGVGWLLGFVGGAVYLSVSDPDKVAWWNRRRQGRHYEQERKKLVESKKADA